MTTFSRSISDATIGSDALARALRELRFLSEAEGGSDFPRVSFLTAGQIVSVTPVQTTVWQRQLNSQNCKHLIDSLLTPDLIAKVQGAVRKYSIEVTNTAVTTPSVLGDNSLPRAWTTAPSPHIVIPPDLNNYVFFDETTKGSYASGQYLDRSYPAKPYKAQVSVAYIDTVTTHTTTFNPFPIQFWGIGYATKKTTLSSGGGTGTGATTLTWANHGLPGLRNGIGNPYVGVGQPNGIFFRFSEYPTNSQGWRDATAFPYVGFTQRYGFTSQGEVVTFIQDALNRFQTFNLFHFPAGFLNLNGVYDAPTIQNVTSFQQQLGALRQDGIVDMETWSLIGGQILRLGANGTSQGHTDFRRFYDYPAIHMSTASVSDGNNGTHWSMISSVSNGPSSIYQGFFLYFDTYYNISGINITPYMEGSTSTVQLTKAQVRDGSTDKLLLQSLSYTLTNGVPFTLPISATNGNNIVVVLTQTRPSFGSSLYIGVSDISATVSASGGTTTGGGGGSGAVVVEPQTVTQLFDPTITGPGTLTYQVVNVVGQPPTTTSQGTTQITQATWTDLVIISGLTVKGALPFFPNMPVNIQNADIYDIVTNRLAYYGPNGEPGFAYDQSTPIPAGRNVWQMYQSGRWCSYVPGNFTYTDNSRPANTPVGTPLATGTIDSSGAITITPTAAAISGGTVTGSTSTSASHITNGPALPGGTTYYSLTPANRYISPIPETGFVSKAEGLKLLCRLDGSPAGFDIPAPTAVANTVQRQYVSFTLNVTTSDPTVVVGFYDNKIGEFILNGQAGGNYAMTYDEYNRRGPQNVYIGVLTTFELDRTMPYPLQDDTAMVPSRWVEPVYGVTVDPDTFTISLQPNAANLGFTDLWPVAVSTGSFMRTVTLRPQIGPNNTPAFSGPVTNYLNPYQSAEPTTVVAYYSVPEAELGGWSALYGRPNIDILNEQPLLLNDTTLQVRQPPIYMQRFASPVPSLADPVRPVFNLLQKQTPTSDWAVVPFSGIRDYDARNGYIYLVDPVTSIDPTLFSISYTSTSRSYYFKGFDLNDHINLNPYLVQDQSLIGEPIYIYILPTYVQDSHGNTIASSVQTRTIRFTKDPVLFDPTSSLYDPLAIELGVIYISTAVNVDDIVLIDSRRRGGGVRDTITDAEARRIASQSSTYWDIDYARGASYQAGGYVYIKLPADVLNDFTPEQIKAVIDRNITIGTYYNFDGTL